MNKKIILGVDPGTIVTGYALLTEDYETLDFGAIKPPKNLPLTDRYLYIYKGIVELIEKYHPESLAIETQFVKDNPQTAIKLGMARGVIVLAAKLHRMNVYEYAPTKIKVAVTGVSHASKAQMQGMTQKLLNLDSLPEPEDAADALAAAICHIHALQTAAVLQEL